jgi:hypothetical protein
VERLPALLEDAAPKEDWLELAAPPEGEDIVFDYATTGLSLRRHPLALLRPLLAKRRLQTAAELAQVPDGALAVAGTWPREGNTGQPHRWVPGGLDALARRVGDAGAGVSVKGVDHVDLTTSRQ